MKKEIRVLYLLIVFALSLSAQESESYNLLWQIEGNGMKQPSYLFGTMHVKDNRAFNLSDSVMTSIEKCDVFALEVEPDSLLSYLFNKKYGSDTTNILKRELGEEDYLKLRNRFEELNGYDLEQLKSKNPMVIKSLLKPNNDKPDDKQTFVDGYLYGIAKTLGKEIKGLENAETQSDLFFGSSKESQSKMILDLIDEDTAKSKVYLELLVNAYSSGNLESIEHLILKESLKDSVMIKRNNVMLNSMIQIMKTQSLFAAVGSAHLLSEVGLINLLRKENYTVTPVKATFTGIADQYKIDPSKMKWHTYEDKDLGFSIEIPGKPFVAEMYKEIGMKVYPDLTTNAYFSFYTLDLRTSKKKEKESQLIDDIINNYKKSNRLKVIKKKKIDKNGFAATELTIKSKSYYFRFQIFTRNNILYALMAGDKKSRLYGSHIQRYFNSFKSSTPLPVVSKEWIYYTNKKGAFSVYLPKEPKETITEIPNPVDPESDPYAIYLYMHLQMPSMTNYLIAYNDLPSGYFLENKGQAFTGIIDELKAKGTILGSIDTIWLDGTEGREFNLMLDDRYYTQCKVYIRSNRIYKILKQNLVQDEKELNEDDFFNSFSFSAYTESEFDTLVVEEENFKMNQFSNHKKETDTTSDNLSYLKNLTTYYTTNPNSGGVYMFQHTDIDEYFRINHIDSFYVEYTELLKGWFDTIVSTDSAMIGNKYGRDVLVENTLNEGLTRHRFWIDNNKMYSITGYLGKDEMFSSTTNNYFNSFRKTGVNKAFDLYSSKTKTILDSLSSSDTNQFNRAIAALNYHFFDDEDLTHIYEALNQSYADDSSNYGVRVHLIDCINEIGNLNSIDSLGKLYSKTSSTDALKSKILISLQSFENKTGYPLYLKSLFNAPPEKPQMLWSMLQAFSDSMQLTAGHFDQFVSLFKKKEYKNKVLTLATSLLSTDSIPFINVVDANLEKLLVHAEQELDSFILEIETSKITYNSDLFEYLDLIEKSKKDIKFTDSFTKKIQASKCADYLKVKASRVRIIKGLELNKKLLKEQLNSMYTRRNILNAFDQIGQLYKVPKKYRTQEEIAKINLTDYLSEDYDYPSQMKFLSKINENDSIFYVFTFSYESDKAKYLGVSGPFPTDQNDNNLKGSKAYSNWDVYEASWRLKAQGMIDKLKSD